MDANDIANRFGFHPANDDTGPRHDQVRHACQDLAHLLNDLLPDGREKSLAITSLEQTMFWANAAVARPRLERG
jgi:hypothetical protein